MLPLLRVESDFKDFYDNLTSSRATVVYRRYTEDNLPRDQVFKRLTCLNVRVVPFGQVKELAQMAKKLVVYTDITKHNKEGKLVLTSSEALLLYPNKLASVFVEKTEAVTYKVLRIGSIVVRLLMEDTDTKGNNGELPNSNVKDIEIIRKAPENILREPIYSIDYIPTEDGLAAVDFNSVENLSALKINEFISGEDIIREVYNHILKYS